MFLCLFFSCNVELCVCQLPIQKFIDQLSIVVHMDSSGGAIILKLKLHSSLNVYLETIYSYIYYVHNSLNILLFSGHIMQLNLSNPYLSGFGKIKNFV